LKRRVAARMEMEAALVSWLRGLLFSLLVVAERWVMTTGAGAMGAKAATLVAAARRLMIVLVAVIVY